MGDGELPRVGFRRDGVGSPWHFTRWIGTVPYTALPNMGDVWRTRPVWFEFFAGATDMRSRGWDIPYSIEWMLTNHVTVVNTGPFRPEGLQADDPLLPLLRRIDLYAGARLVPTSASTRLENGVLTISLTGENKGVAPIHLPYEAVYAFQSTDGRIVAEHVAASDPTTWLPGPFILSGKLTPPSSPKGDSYSRCDFATKAESCATSASPRLSAMIRAPSCSSETETAEGYANLKVRADWLGSLDLGSLPDGVARELGEAAE